MRPDLDAIRARSGAAFTEDILSRIEQDERMLASALDVPVLLDYIRELEDALESLSDGRITPMDVANEGEARGAD